MGAVKALVTENELLKEEIERLEAAEKLSTEGFLGLTKMFNEQRAEVERLTARLAIAESAVGMAEAVGMEAAVKDVRRCPWIQGPVIAEWLRRKIAAAKQLAGEAGSRELLPPATPSPGSASPASHQELCERARLEQDEADYPTPTCCDSGEAQETT